MIQTAFDALRNNGYVETTLITSNRDGDKLNDYVACHQIGSMYIVTVVYDSGECETCYICNNYDVAKIVMAYWDYEEPIKA